MKKKILTYTVIFTEAPEGGYTVHVPLLPGCVTEGDSFEEAKEKAKDAIEGYIAVLKEFGDEIPLETEEYLSAKVSVPVII